MPVKKKKEKWDDEKEGRKPWEAAPKKGPLPSVAAPPKKKKKKKRRGVGSLAEDIHNELVDRNKKTVRHVGGWSKSDK